VTYARIGLSDVDKQVLKAEKSVAQATNLIANLANAATAAVADPTVADLSSRRTEAADDAGNGDVETVDSFGGVSVGQIVSLSDGREGRIEHIMIGGTLGVPGSRFAIQGTANDPAVQIRIFENGAETENVVNVRFSEINAN
jgi:hypothetical protein